jgi:hypothetical protein
MFRLNVAKHAVLEPGHLATGAQNTGAGRGGRIAIAVDKYRQMLLRSRRTFSGALSHAESPT